MEDGPDRQKLNQKLAEKNFIPVWLDKQKVRYMKVIKN